ncbi:hypothetical protein V1525DRAFT_439247 [Lipomyces kononenkoae]|uniref:Uncharacterized protein n=1 Tax=Lipomyces kononenkoae TaxID=34357 RepID=A0ACC3STY9_LIPKO
MRKTFARLSTEQLQFIAGSTQSNYIAWTRAQNIPVQSIQISHLNTKAFWIGDDQADTVLYFHGGGLYQCYSVRKVGRSSRPVVLQYDLAPAEHYPRQVTQCVELLRWNYGLHRSLAHSAPASIHNANKALNASPSGIPVQSRCQIQLYCREVSPERDVTSGKDKWNEPGQNDVEWWKGLTEVVKGMLITIATDEVMADNVQAMASKITTVYTELTLFSSKNDFHAEPGIGFAVGLEESVRTGV